MSQKTFNTQMNIGRAKYCVSFHDGVKTHKDGSEFSDIAIFSNKKALLKFQNELLANGYSNA